jgi:hypothetical protein
MNTFLLQFLPFKRPLGFLTLLYLIFTGSALAQFKVDVSGVGLTQVPIAIVTAEASPFSYFDGHLTAFLDQVGCQSTLLRLAEQGILGNGHGMMMEKNNAEVLAVIEGWISQLPTAGK